MPQILNTNICVIIINNGIKECFCVRSIARYYFSLDYLVDDLNVPISAKGGGPSSAHYRRDDDDHNDSS